MIPYYIDIKRSRHMSFINSTDARFRDIRPIPEIDNIETLKNGMSIKWNSGDVELCGSGIELIKDDNDNYSVNIFPRSTFNTYEGFFENTEEVLNADTVSFNYSFASPTFKIEDVVDEYSSADSNWALKTDRAAAFIKAIDDDIDINRDTIKKISWQKYVMYQPKIVMHFTDKKIHTMKKSDYTKYKNSLTTASFYVKNMDILNINDLTFNNVQGCAFVYDIYSSTANFSDIYCFVQSINQSLGYAGTSIYDGTTSLDNIKNLPEFQYVDDWSLDGTMYIIIKNTDDSTNAQIPFKLCKVQKATKTNDNGQSEIYPEILEEYNMYYISQEYTPSNENAPLSYRKIVMCDINISSMDEWYNINDDIHIKKRTYTTSNINLMYGSNTINDFRALTSYTEDNKQRNYKYTYFFITPIANTFDFAEYLQIVDNDNNVKEFSGINVQRTDVNIYEEPINQALFNSNKTQFRANEQFENYTYVDGGDGIYFFDSNHKSPLQFASAKKWINIYSTDEAIVGDATATEKKSEVIIGGSTFIKPIEKPICYLQNINVSGSYINITKFNESYRSNNKLHYKKNGDPCKTKETSIRKFITTTRPDIIYCFGDGNEHGLFGNNNYVSHEYADDEGNTKTKMLGISRRAHNRRLISNRDVGILKGNMQLIKLIHNGTIIDNYHKYINDYLKTHEEGITNYDIIDIHLFKRRNDADVNNNYVTSFDYSRYFTDYLGVNVKKSYQYIMEYLESTHSQIRYDQMIRKLQYFDHTIYSNLLGDNETDKKIKKHLYAHQPLLVLLWNNSYKFAIDNLLMGIVAKNIYVTTAQVLKYTGLVFTEKEMIEINQTMCSILYEYVIKFYPVLKPTTLRSTYGAEYRFIRGYFCYNFSNPIDISNIIDTYGLTEQQKIIVKHNLLQLYVIKGYGNTEYDKIYNNDFADMTYRKPKFKQVTYRNYSKNADSEEPKKNIRKRIKFIVSEDNITKSQLFVDGVTSQD